MRSHRRAINTQERGTMRITGGKVTLVVGFLVVTHVSMQQPLQAQPPARDSISTVTISGFVDGYFSWNFGRPRSHINRLANFDLAENQFVMSAAEIDVQMATNPVGVHIEMAVGSAADIINAGSSESAKLFQQAYLSAVIPVGAGLTVDAGKFVTHMGFETIKTKDNHNYSRSYLFSWAIPYYHTGIRASYSLRDNLTAAVHFCNGWNNVTANSGKTFGASMVFAPTASLSLIANWLGGPEQPDSVGSDFRHVVEGVITLQATDRLAVGVDGMYGTEKLSGGTATWKGAAVYGRYLLTETSAISVRGELYSDPDGYTTASVQDLGEMTFTYEQRFLGALILRAEYRYDWSTAQPFDGSDGDAMRNNQSRLGLACIVTF
jgi:hypothetical protein